MALKKNKIILVYQIGSLGDTIVSIPCYRVVRRHFGDDADIKVLHNVPVGKRAVPSDVLTSTGLIDGSVGYVQRSNQLWTLMELWLKLMTRRVDHLVYVLPGQRSASSIQRDKTFFRCCGIRNLLGFVAAAPEIFHLRPTPTNLLPCPHEALIRLDRLLHDGMEIKPEDTETPLVRLTDTDRDAAIRWLSDNGRDFSKPLISIAPGANQPANFWAQERFLELTLQLTAAGYQPMLIGGPLEHQIALEIADNVDGAINAVAKMSVMESAALIAQSILLIGLDTGTTHLAAAVDIPVVALYGDKNAPGQWEPMGQKHVVLRHHVRCGGCGLTVCNVVGHPCMSVLTTDQVLRTVLEMLRTLEGDWHSE
jgi:heptosyltransferase III